MSANLGDSPVFRYSNKSLRSVCCSCWMISWLLRMACVLGWLMTWLTGACVASMFWYSVSLAMSWNSWRSASERSEEHTSELQHPSISYAVFCLKKKKSHLQQRALLVCHEPHAHYGVPAYTHTFMLLVARTAMPGH